MNGNCTTVARGGGTDPLRYWGSRIYAFGAFLAMISSVFAAAAPASVAAEGCANEAQRIEQASALPDCRAYEMVTPQLKGSGEPEPISGGETEEARDIGPLHSTALYPANGARAGFDGTRMAWVSEPVPGARAPGISYLATRQAAGWTSEDLVPPMSPFNDLLCPLLMGVSGWSADLAKSVLDLPAGPPSGFFGEEECGYPEPRLVPSEPDHLRNLFVRDNLTGAHQLINVTPAGVAWPQPEEPSQRYWPASFLAGSDDLEHVVFEEELALTDDAPIGYRGGDELYEWTAGEVRLVTILPDGTPVHGSLAGATRNYAAESEPAGVSDKAINIAQFRHAISADGSRIFFEAQGGLYMREDGTETVQVDASQGPGPDGGGRFMVASADGSRVFFTSENQLTADSTATFGQPDLYEYETGTGELTDLTVSSPEPAGVLGVSGASEDGSRLYFVALGALTNAPNSSGDAATAGAPNLYLIQDGATTFVATLDPGTDACDWTASARCAGDVDVSGLTARVSSNGAFVGFNSTRSLTGYDNTDANTGEPDIEIFLYDAEAGQLSCASCHPLGGRPTAGAAIHWPANPGKNGNWDNAYPQRNVSDNGQVFFETADALLPRDENGRRDVYEFADGELYLISTGTHGVSSHFLDATPDGSNVFFSTAQRLLPRDTDSVYDYYDARVGGGFAEPIAREACGAGPCRGPATPSSSVPLPGTSSFAGPGNQRPRTCRSLARRAAKLDSRAAQLRRKAARRAGQDQAAVMRRQAKRLATRADRLSKKAKRCRRANRRAGK
jgi:hypothetical protein